MSKIIFTCTAVNSGSEFDEICWTQSNLLISFIMISINVSSGFNWTNAAERPPPGDFFGKIAHFRRRPTLTAKFRTSGYRSHANRATNTFLPL